MKKMTPAADEMFAREQIDLLRQKRFEQIERELDPSIAGPNTQDILTTMAGMFPTEEPKSVKVVDLKFVKSRESSTHTLTLEYEFSERWLLVSISIKKTSALSTIAGFNVTPIADSLENVNRFTFSGKSSVHYLMLGLALTEPIFCLYALVICLRTRQLNLKWLWAIFILFGVGSLSINWTTGDLAFTPLALHIPCASVTAVPAYGPWMVAVSLPIGAILFMARRYRNTMQNEMRQPPTEHLPPTLP